MRDAARIATVIEILSSIETSVNTSPIAQNETGLPSLDGPLDAILAGYFRARRYLGSGDRAALAEQIFTLVRRRARLYWWLERYNQAHRGEQIALNPRSLVIANLVLSDRWRRAQFANHFDGDKYNAKPLMAAEVKLAEYLADKDLDDAAQPDWVRYECPRFLLPIISAEFNKLEGDNDAHDAKKSGLAAMMDKASLDLRLNRLQQNSDAEGFRQDVIRELAAADIKAVATPLSPLGLRIDGHPPISKQDAFLNGKIEIQDEGSQIVSLLAAAKFRMEGGKKSGGLVLDYCAGAGGKTLAIAAEMGNRGKIIAADISAKRLERAQKRFRRAAIHNVECRALDKENHRFWQRQSGRFDVVLVDAPCTGTGTWRRNPDMKWRISGQDITELSALQGKILREASIYVAAGGWLVYATCSLLPEENEGVIAAFLAEYGEKYSVVAVPSIWQQIFNNNCPSAGEFLRLYPHIHECDGFFSAILQASQK